MEESQKSKSLSSQMHGRRATLKLARY